MTVYTHLKIYMPIGDSAKGGKAERWRKSGIG